MRHALVASFAAAVLVAVAAVPAVAAPVVASGSSYSIYLSGLGSDGEIDPVLLSTQFDGSAQSFTRGGLNLSLTETEFDLGGGRSRIVIDLSADGDLFPTPGEAGSFGVGLGGDVLDLTRPVFLDAGFIRLTGAFGVWSTNNLADDYRDLYFSGAWDGAFMTTNGTIAIGNTGNWNITHVRWEFEVSDLAVPEPGALSLAGIALLALVGVRRRGSLSR